MKYAWSGTAKFLTGFFAAAVCALPQTYTVSAKPGVVNFIEGTVTVNGRKVSSENLRLMFLNANDTIATATGKAEVLLAPGVFLRLADNTQVRMISPSLTDTQIEVKAGEAMVEADDIVKDSRVSVLNGGSTALVEKNGLYRFTASEPRAVAVLEGKLAVSLDGKTSDIGKGHELLLEDGFKTAKFDAKKQDDLYAWSNVRAEYNAASSYQAAKDVSLSSYGGTSTWGGYGFSGFTDPGWFWNSGFNSWAWVPGNSAFYSPFGYGFYGPGMVAYAPYVYAPVYGGGGGVYRRPVTTTTSPTKSAAVASTSKPVMAAVPVNPVHPAAIGHFSNSFAGNQAARGAAMHSYASTGFHTAAGMNVPAGRAAAAYSGGHAASAGGGGHAVAAGGSGVSGASYGAAHVGGGGAVSAASAGGGHSGGGGGGGGGHH